MIEKENPEWQRAVYPSRGEEPLKWGMEVPSVMTSVQQALNKWGREGRSSQMLLVGSCWFFLEKVMNMLFRFWNENEIKKMCLLSKEHVWVWMQMYQSRKQIQETW